MGTDTNTIQWFSIEDHRNRGFSTWGMEMSIRWAQRDQERMEKAVAKLEETLSRPMPEADDYFRQFEIDSQIWNIDWDVKTIVRCQESIKKEIAAFWEEVAAYAQIFVEYYAK